MMNTQQEFEIVRKAARLFEDAANTWMARALKAEAKLEDIAKAVNEYRCSQIWDQEIEEILERE